MNVQQKRIELLQEELRRKNLHALYIPMDDEHLNEYVLEKGKRLAWLLGFSGSAGEALLTQEECFLFVDSRYYTQADLEVKDLGVTVCKLGLAGHPTMLEKLASLSKQIPAIRFALDPFTVSVKKYRRFSKLVEHTGGSCISLEKNLIDTYWTDAPPLPETQYEEVPLEYCGQSASEKIQAVRAALADNTILLVTKLDQIAWLINLRGFDVPYNPVFVSYAILSPKKLEVFLDQEKLPADFTKTPEISFRPYEEYASALKELSKEYQIAFDPEQITQGSLSCLNGHQFREKRIPVFSQKAIKNSAELNAMKEANLKASRAKIRALAWLDKQVTQGNKISEKGFLQQIESFYAQEEGYRGQSFRTISATGKNSAIVHYGKSNDEAVLRQGELFLIDSGAHYLGGTTDDTRTVIIGEANQEQRRVYSAVLRGHIALGTQIFPEYATGAQLDAVARTTVWRSLLNYGHGTGHGVGAYLNVHEGPNRIAWPITETFRPGMITSNEPGAYQEGWGGVRIENLAMVTEEQKIGGVAWYRFEDLTYIPYDQKLIEPKELTSFELDAIDRYHEEVCKKLAPSLDEESRTWLENACRPLERISS